MTIHPADTPVNRSSVASYMGGITPVAGPRGLRMSPYQIEAGLKTFAITPQVIEVCPGVHNLVGIGISSRTMIEAPEGLVIFDTGDDREDGERALAEFRKISQRPIRAIIYSHNHYSHGAGPFVEGQGDVQIIGHKDVNRHIEEMPTGFATGGLFPEAMPTLTARYLRQFGSALAREGADGGIGSVIEGEKPRATVPANKLVEHGEELVVAGLRMKFFARWFSDSEDTLTVWIPELGVALNNFLWPALFNFYTPRGDVFRDPASWRNGLLEIRDLEPTHIINTHALPISCKDAVRETLTLYADSISYTIDQTLRGIHKGYGPDYLREFVRLPDRLRALPHNCETYSEFSYFPPHLYYHIFGWFTGDAACMQKLPAGEEARRIVAGFGGADRMLGQARDALAAEEFVWACRLADWLYLTDRDNADYRAVKAEALRQIAHRAPLKRR